MGMSFFQKKYSGCRHDSTDTDPPGPQVKNLHTEIGNTNYEVTYHFRHRFCHPSATFIVRQFAIARESRIPLTFGQSPFYFSGLKLSTP